MFGELTAHQDALVHVAVAAVLHADAHDAGVGPLLVVDGPRGAGARRRGGHLTARGQGAGAEVRVGRAAGGEGGARGAGGGEEVLGDVVQGARQGLRAGQRMGRYRGFITQYKS